MPPRPSPQSQQVAISRSTPAGNVIGPGHLSGWLAYPPKWLAAVILLSIAGIWLSVVGHQVLSWRQAAGEHRQQLKWLATGAAVTIGLALIGSAAVKQGIVQNLLEVGLIALALGVGVGILAATALFNPLRRHVQKVVDHRFNRARHDADQTVAAFAARLKEALDLGSVRDDLAGVVHQALEPTHVSVLIRTLDGTNDRLPQARQHPVNVPCQQRSLGSERGLATPSPDGKARLLSALR